MGCSLGSDGSFSTRFNACDIFKSEFCVSSPAANIIVAVESGFVKIGITSNADYLRKSSALTWGNGTTTGIKVTVSQFISTLVDGK